MFSYHNHSVFSDGSATLEEMVIAGINSGLTEVGISDHFSVSPDGEPIGWSMTQESLGEYFAQLTRLKELYSASIVLRRGVEIDFFPENIDTVTGMVNSYAPDYIIGSVHFADGARIDHCAEDWTGISADRADEIKEAYWKKIIGIAQSRKADIIGHLDLCKKYGSFGRKDMSLLEHEALEAIRDSGLAMELNTAGLYKPAREIYPSEKLLSEAVRMEIPLLINADAHYSAHLRRSFFEAARLLGRLGVKTIVSFENRRQVVRSLDY